MATNDIVPDPESVEPKAPSVDERLKNHQAEMNRKIDSLNQLVTQQNKQMQDLIAVQVSRASPNVAPSQRTQQKLSELMYNDPDAYAAEIQRISSEAAAHQSQMIINSNNQTAFTLSNLTAEYPELNDQGSDLTKRAVEIFKGMSDSEKTNQATAYKSAIREAASDLGIVAVKHRKGTSDSDTFTVGSSGSGRQSDSNRAKGQKNELDPATIEFARHMGLPVDDPKYITKLKNAAKRDTFNKWR